MTLISISCIFREFRGISQISEGSTAKRMKTDQYCQRQRCKHVELVQFLACFRVARGCQRQLGFLVHLHVRELGVSRNCQFVDITAYLMHASFGTSARSQLTLARADRCRLCVSLTGDVGEISCWRQKTKIIYDVEWLITWFVVCDDEEHFYLRHRVHEKIDKSFPQRDNGLKADQLSHWEWEPWRRLKENIVLIKQPALPACRETIRQTISRHKMLKPTAISGCTRAAHSWYSHSKQKILALRPVLNFRQPRTRCRSSLPRNYCWQAPTSRQNLTIYMFKFIT